MPICSGFAAGRSSKEQLPRTVWRLAGMFWQHYAYRFHKMILRPFWSKQTHSQMVLTWSIGSLNLNWWGTEKRKENGDRFVRDGFQLETDNEKAIGIINVCTVMIWHYLEISVCTLFHNENLLETPLSIANLSLSSPPHLYRVSAQS